ncbi:MAG TPA: DUF4097 family beta strand repeat-containing protein [Gillisia sp.]|nr:DUF4097 family beta strand repeat-containing protein [Gillisia sp.]
MKNKTSVSVFMTLAVMLLSFGCAEVSVNPNADVITPGIIVDHKYKAYLSFEYSAGLSKQTTFSVENINGEVEIQSVTGISQVLISGEKIVSSDSYQDAYSHLKDITVDINELTSKLIVKTTQPDFSKGRSYSINYVIKVPSQLSISVINVNGKISGQVSVPANGTIDINLQNGNIDLGLPQSTSAEFFASLLNGSISMQNLTLYNKVETSKTLRGRLGEGQGTVTLKTTNGKISVAGF